MRAFRTVLVCLVVGFLVQSAVFAAPTITSFLTSRPAQARVGEPVIIAAIGLANPVHVFFTDGSASFIEATGIEVDLDRGLILARVPVGAVTGNVRITAGGFISPHYYFTVEPGAFVQGTNEVSGIVTKTGTAQPGVGLVLLRGAQCGNVVFQDFAVSDPNGAYSLHGTDGPYQIFIFPPRNAGVANSSVPVVLTSTPGTADIALVAGTEVTGRVVDETMTGLPNVRVSIDLSGGILTHDEILTDPNGVFTAHLLPGEHEYTIEPPPGSPLASAHGSFFIDATLTQTLGDTTLASGVTITGTLTRATGGTPLASVELLIYDPTTCCTVTDTKTTAGDGSFTLVVPPNGTYDIRSEMDNRTSVSDVQVYGVVVGSTPVEQNLTATEAAIVSGTLTLQGAGTPLACVGVQAVGPGSGGNYGFGRSDLEGNYRLRLVPDPDGYIVNTSGTDGGGIEYATKTWDGTPAGTYFICEGTPVTATTAGVTTPGIDFSLEPGAAIEGIVTAEEDLCVADLGQSFFVFVDDGTTHSCNMGVPDFNFPGPGYRVHMLPPATNLRACVYPQAGYDAQCYDTKLPPDSDPITTTAGNTTPDINFCLKACTEVTWYADTDEDSFGDPNNTTRSCVQPTGYVPDMTDCDDASPGINPGEAELCDGLDNNCDEQNDEGLIDLTCGIGGCETTVASCVDGVPQVCVPLTGSPETCNGIDDDCNGNIDDLLGTTSCGVGACSRTVQNCADGVPQACTPGSPGLDDAVCNGVDDDCDGQTDEEFVPSPTVCGVGACAATGETTCVNGAPGDSCVAGAPTAESCNNIDDNCDGTVDDFATTCGVGACASTGSCQAGVDSCTAGQPGTEICDGVDNDCNGSVDDGFTPQPTTCGVGACAATGETTCVNGALGDSCVAGAPTTESCNNVDDNCDGTVDDFATTCGVGACASTGSCQAGVDSCTAGQPGTEICDGVDNDCNGPVDDGFTPQPTTCGLGACAATGETTCVNGALGDSCVAGIPTTESCNNIDDNCDGTVDDFATTCGVGACASTGSCQTGVDSCTAGQPGTEICDGVDNDCNGPVDDGFTPQPTTCGLGACAATGQTTCVNGALGDSCVAGAPTTESCNNIDDNCDGTVDDFATTCGVGACASTGSCQAGVDSCTAGQPGTEICDGVDNDCNGAVDGFATSCGVGSCASSGTCVTGVDSCTAGQPGTETCDGQDNDCDGASDEGNPGGGVACGTGLSGICTAGMTTCQQGVLACIPDFSPGTESCNGLDDDCDGTVDDVDGGCSLYMTDPMDGEMVDCRPGAPAPTLTWNPAQYDKYEVFLSGDPAYNPKLSINSGSTLLKVATWTVPAKKWKSLCAKVTTTMYLSVYGVDNDVPKSDPTRKFTSPSVTVTVQK